MLKKKSVTEMKNAFDGLFSRLETAEERISESGETSVETFQNEMQKGKKKKNRTTKHYGAIPKGIT